MLVGIIAITIIVVIAWLISGVIGQGEVILNGVSVVSAGNVGDVGNITPITTNENPSTSTAINLTETSTQPDRPLVHVPTPRLPVVPVRPTPVETYPDPLPAPEPVNVYQVDPPVYQVGPLPSTPGPLPSTSGPLPSTSGPLPSTSGPLPSTSGPLPSTSGPGPLPRFEIGPLPQFEVGPVPQLEPYVYLGCYNEISARDLPMRIVDQPDAYLTQTGPNYTVDQCYEFAVNNGSNVFGVQYYQGAGGIHNGVGECWINPPGKTSYGQGGDALDCLMTPYGKMIGGSSINAIYQVN